MKISKKRHEHVVTATAHRHSQPRIRPFVYTHRAKKGGVSGIKVHCIIEARRNSVMLDYKDGSAVAYEQADAGHPNYNLVSIYLKEAFDEDEKPLSLLRLSSIFIPDSAHNELPIKVELALEEDGIDEHDGTATVHPPDADGDETPQDPEDPT